MGRSARVRRHDLRTGLAAAVLAVVAMLVTACVPTPFVKAGPAVTVTATPTPTPGHLIVAGYLNLHGRYTNFYAVDGHSDIDDRCTALPGDFDDIGEGTRIDVMSTTDAETVVASGFLAKGFEIRSRDHSIMCSFRFAILDVPAGLGMYKIAVVGHEWSAESERAITGYNLLSLGATP